MKSASDYQFGLSITSSYTRHVEPTLFNCEDVRQRITPPGGAAR